MRKAIILQNKLRKKFGETLSVKFEDGCVKVSGRLKNWNDIINACYMCVQRDKRVHVVNDIALEGTEIPKAHVPSARDNSLDGRKPDVLVVGGGISGASIARELTKWKIDVLLVDKEPDLAAQTSGRNDGEVHPGIDLNKGTLKQKYVLSGNKIYDKICGELNVPFRRCGQYVVFTQKFLLPFARLYVWQRKHVCGVRDTKIISGKELREREPYLNEKIAFAVYNPSAGCVCPYGLTIAYGENAIKNGAEISLDTAVLSMETTDGKISSVETNRGTIYPGIVINAAGVFAEDIAKMAGDRFYSIHPRRGTDFILDKKAGYILKSIASVKILKQTAAHSKGGGILHTVHDNILVGPNAEETFEKENFATEAESVDAVFDKQSTTSPSLKKSDIITYFTGVRAPTFEEDFVIEKGRKTENIIHCAGIQSPGLTAAPAIALDVEKMTIEMLKKYKKVEKNLDFNPIRKGIPVLREMSDEERDRLIKKNPDYGVIVCRCEEVSKGEVLDALRSPLTVPTIDGIKKRVRPGMGRCQGGFCSPLIAKIIHEETGLPLEEVKKSSKEAVVTYGPTKGAANENL